MRTSLLWPCPAEPIHEATTLVTGPAIQPVSRIEAKLQAKAEQTADDPLIDSLILAATTQLERDTHLSLVQTTWDHTLEQLPGGRIWTLPRSPAVSVASIKTTDEDAVESTMSTSDYFLDTKSMPARIILTPAASWPSDVRAYNAAVARFTAGYSGTSVAVTSITRSSQTATVTATAHGFSSGQRITISGAVQDEYNGTFTIAVTAASTFTFPVTGSPTTPATGTILATNLGIPVPLYQALMLLIAHWYRFREAIADGTVAKIPFGYDELIGNYQLLEIG